MLSNLETEKSKLVQIVLVGQPNLRDSLDLPFLEQLRQRVTVRYHLGPLDEDETARYINHRLKRAAAWLRRWSCSRDVTDLVHSRSGGVPRLINVICDAALLAGYAEERRVIDVALVQSAIDDLEASNVLRRTSAPSRSTATVSPQLDPALLRPDQARVTPPPVPAPAACASTPPPVPQAAPPAAELRICPCGRRRRRRTRRPSRSAIPCGLATRRSIDTWHRARAAQLTSRCNAHGRLFGRLS